MFFIVVFILRRVASVRIERDSILAEAVYCLNTNFRLIWNKIIN